MNADERLKAVVLNGPTDHAWRMALAALAARADDQGIVKAPSPELLGLWACLSDRWALSCIRHLKAQGWIERATDTHWYVRTEPSSGEARAT
jgi:hypothetical protein